MSDKPEKKTASTAPKKKRVKHRLPKKIIAIPNPDKVWHEKWTEHRDLLNIPHPFRCVLLGPPNSGKTTVMKNIIVRCKPEFEEIMVVHCDKDDTKEFDDLDVDMLDDIPTPEEIDPDSKKLIILEDLEYGSMDKDTKKALDRLFGYVSTHKNLSVMLTAQDPFSVPAICRRCANLWVIWRVTDIDALSTVGRRTGMKSKHFSALFEKFINDTKDSIWVDLTSHSPAPLRLNGYQIIKKK